MTNLPGTGRRGERGFTLLEVVVATLVTVEVILAALALFDFHNKLARVQAQLSDMQQSLRVAQYDMVRLTREAGRGSLPAVVKSGAYGAIGVRNNVVAASDQVAIGFSGTPKAVDGTDILTVRGAFSLPIFVLDPSGPGIVTLVGGATPATATAGRVVVCASTKSSIPQDLTSLIGAVNAAKTAGQVEALILVSSLGDNVYAVVELDAGNSVLTGNQPACPASTANPNGVLIAFNITGDATANSFQQLGAVNGPAGLPAVKSFAVATLGVLEEYRYYVRQDATLNNVGDPVRHLSRARMYPGTETPYYGDPTYLKVDVADNVLDLQVALGVDNNRDGVITEGSGAGNPPDQTPSNADEWIYNLTGDQPFPSPGLGPLIEVRISSLASTGSPDVKYQGPKLTSIEDHTYLATDFANTVHGRCYRHRLLTTVVGLRNL